MPDEQHGSKHELHQIVARTADAVSEQASAVKELTGIPSSMGLNGLFAQIGNISAIALVCAVFYILVTDLVRSNRESQEILRMAVQQLHSDIQKLAAAVEKAGVKR